ncbi:hypothetical protein QBC47DRAFT_409635 [Echria macrotheca]|uniref:Uncharacterized protein n=1 Tax=Echria macrotheca TaxID=438768 RepID=A0AAJ0BIX8_9PEZI|nr:hypothetical protein QBC47DRAFT_409635 [Echria macrotheca]
MSQTTNTKPESDDRTFEKLDLPAPLNWSAGKSLFPGRVISGFHGDLDQYDAEGWAQHVLEQCKDPTNSGCTTGLGFQATNSGDEPKTRFWFGYLFGGVPATVKDFERSEDVSDAVVYTIVLKNDGDKEVDAVPEL